MQRFHTLSTAIPVLSGVFFTIAVPVAYGYYVSDNISVQQQGDIAFITGGVGDEELQAMQALRRDYNLQVMSYGSDGAFTADNRLAIYDRMGNEVLMSEETGPLFYANLPAGKYIVALENGGDVQKKSVKVAQVGAVQLHFVWK